MTGNPGPAETPAEEEDARLTAETAQRDAAIARRVAVLESDGVGDGLHGALTVLLDERLVPVADRADRIVEHVLQVIATRELTTGDAKAAALADAARDQADALDEEANRYGDRGGDSRSGFFRDIAATLDRLSGRKHDG